MAAANRQETEHDPSYHDDMSYYFIARFEEAARTYNPDSMILGYLNVMVDRHVEEINESLGVALFALQLATQESTPRDLAQNFLPQHILCTRDVPEPSDRRLDPIHSTIVRTREHLRSLFACDRDAFPTMTNEQWQQVNDLLDQLLTTESEGPD